MANSRKSKSSELATCLDRELARCVRPGARLTVALSGGVDSTVLLDLLAPRAARFRISCLHVNHGISPNADAWARFCRRLAASYGLPCRVKKVDLAPYRSLGLEGAARAARYAVFAAERAAFIVLAQHRDDQAETVLLQLVRGGGLRGLAAMPAAGPPPRSDGPSFLRPLLDVPRAEIEAHARARGLRWVEDETNADEALARNFVRRRVMPLLHELNPAADANLARSARHLAEADTLLGELAAIDAAACMPDGRIRVDALQGLGAARARNLLRWFIRAQGLEVPGSAELGEMLRQVVGARRDASVRFDLGGAVLRRYRGALWLARPEPGKSDGEEDWVWHGERVWRLPELGGVLRFGRASGAGLRAAAARAGRLTLRRRVGGESMRPRAGGPRRTVKKLLQEHGIPPWERESLPLVYCNGELVCLPGVAVEAAWQARAGEAGLHLAWEYAGASGAKPARAPGKTG
jgi:tRNA(Ile)-lysidine synthase